MDERGASPEVDVVGNGHKSNLFHRGSERSSYASSGTSTGLRNLLAANTNIGTKKKSETVNLRVRNKGIVKVKKEPESDEDGEGSFSISSLLEECDFAKTSRQNNRSKSPTSFGTGKSKSTASSKPGSPAQGRPRQSLENVISSLKSARAMDGGGTPKSLGAPTSVPAQIGPAAPTVLKVSAPVHVGCSGPQIVDVRSLASVVRPSISHGSVPVTTQQQTLTKTLNTGKMQSSVASTPATVAQTTSASVATKPINIRFVLPANVPFNTDQFQKVLQATLASVTTQAKAIEPDQLQKAIQAALTCVTKSTVAFNTEQLKQAIQNSLTLATGSSPISQAAQMPPSTGGEHRANSTQRQPQPIAPKPPLLPAQSLFMHVDAFNTQNNQPVSGNSKKSQSPSPALVSSPVTVVSKINTSDGNPVVNSSNSNQSSSMGSISASHLKKARDQLVKALQQNRVLSVRAPLPSTMVSCPSSSEDPDAHFHSFDHNAASSSPPPSASPVTQMPVSNSAVEGRNLNSTSTPAASSESATQAQIGTSLVTSAKLPQTRTGSNQDIEGSALSVTSMPIPQTEIGAPTPSSAGVISQAGQITPSVIPVLSAPKANLPPGAQISVSSMPLQPTPGPTKVSNINLKISVPLSIPSSPLSAHENKNSGVTVQNEPSPVGCGCCSKCKSVPQCDNIYTCHYKGCTNVYNSEQGLRRHHYFYPNHKPRIPIEKATRSVKYFLPDDMMEANRAARLRELFKRLTPGEIKEYIMPSLAKTLSLFELLEVKSMRSQTIRGQSSISAFKMFSEFERFRKEVENRLLMLILLPQGRGRGRGRGTRGEEEEEELTAAAKEAGNTEVTQQGCKEIPATVIIHDGRTESSAGKPSKVLSSSSCSSGTPEKTITIIDSGTERASATPATTLQMVVSPSMENCSQKGDTSSGKDAEKMPGDTPKESTEGESVKGPKQYGATAQPYREGNVEIACAAAQASEPLICASGSIAVPMKTKDLQKKASSDPGQEPVIDPLTGVTMGDAKGKIVNSNQEKPKASKDSAGEKIVVELEKLVASVGDRKQTLAGGNDKRSEDTSEKKSSIAFEESKGDVEKSSAVSNEGRSQKLSENQPFADAEENTGDQKSLATSYGSQHGSGKEPATCREGQLGTEQLPVDIEENNGGKKSLASGNDGYDVGEAKSSVSSERSSRENILEGVTVEGHQNNYCSQTESVNTKAGDLAVKGSSVDENSASNGGEQIAMKLDEDGQMEVDKGKEHEENHVDEVSGKSSHPTHVDMTEKETQTDLSDLKRKLSQMLTEITFDDEEEVDESSLLEFGLPFAVKWGKVIKTVRHLEARKIARRENYSEQDMKQFIYGKPKEAANAVISADCHAHPSFFRAYVMPALLDKHIDDFGLFGKKLLSRLYLSKTKYVDILRSKIGPEFAKIMGINIFPTFKRIHDTCQSVKMMTPQDKAKRSLVLRLLPEDECEVPDDKDGMIPSSSGGSQSVHPSAVRGPNSTTQTSVVGVAACSAQNVTSRRNDHLKRPSQPDRLGDTSKKPRLDNSDCSQAKQVRTPSSAKEAIDSDLDDTNNDRAADSTDSSSKDVTTDIGQPSGSNVSQGNQPGHAEKRNKTPSASESTAAETKGGSAGSPSLSEKTAVDNSTGTEAGPASSVRLPEKETAANSSKDESKESTPSTSQTKRNTSSDDTHPKPPSTTNPTSLIPTKAMIYTSTGKGGASLPFSTAKSSPLYLVPMEKLPPKLVEQFINQGKDDGVKTRSASSVKKGKQAKPSSQVLVLIPSTTPNGSPTIQRLTSEEQLKANGDSKPLLLLPEDKVPKSMANQAPSARRKMMITMVAPSSRSETSTGARNVVATTSTSSAGHKDGSTSSGQVVQTPVMSTKESSAKSDTAVAVVTSDDKDSGDTSATSLRSVVTRTSPLNTAIENDVTGKPEAGLTTNSDGTDKAGSATCGGPGEKSSGETASVESSEAIAACSSDFSKSQTSTTSTNSEDVGIQSCGELDLLPSLLPSDLTFDNLIQEIGGEGPASASNEMMSFDVSDIVNSIEDMPIESSSNPSAKLSNSTVATALKTVTGDSDLEARSSGQRNVVGEDRSLGSRRQSPRRVAASSKSTLPSSLAEVSSPNTSGGSREGSDSEDGSPPRKRRKTPIRAAARSSPLLKQVPDKEVPGKNSQSPPTRVKTRKQ